VYEAVFPVASNSCCVWKALIDAIRDAPNTTSAFVIDVPCVSTSKALPNSRAEPLHNNLRMHATICPCFVMCVLALLVLFLPFTVTWNSSFVIRDGFCEALSIATNIRWSAVWLESQGTSDSDEEPDEVDDFDDVLLNRLQLSLLACFASVRSGGDMEISCKARGVHLVRQSDRQWFMVSTTKPNNYVKQYQW
jgi:hypothetical protein